ncbi:hypothetical protein FF1_042470 [Malus domestica]
MMESWNRNQLVLEEVEDKDVRVLEQNQTGLSGSRALHATHNICRLWSWTLPGPTICFSPSMNNRRRREILEYGWSCHLTSTTKDTKTFHPVPPLYSCPIHPL